MQVINILNKIQNTHNSTAVLYHIAKLNEKNGYISINFGCTRAIIYFYYGFVRLIYLKIILCDNFLHMYDLFYNNS